MATCTKCLMNSHYPSLTFNEKGICSLCENKKVFHPKGEDKLIKIFDDIKSKNREYDALVPISGGKDSTYILHLAVNVYHLKVLSMTYDNGLLNPVAIENINKAVKKTGVKHIFSRPDPELQKRIYRAMLLKSGDICGVCDIATKTHTLKVARAYKVPMILFGTSPLENDSFIPDSIQDITRMKYILKETGEFKKKELNKFLIYPKFNNLTLSIWKKTGVIGKEVRPLFYIKNPSDKEMGEIIKREFDWKDDHSSEYSKHFDCIAEPLTNYIRHQIYGYERRICQFSNMIRRDEINREKALQLFEKDNISTKPEGYQNILKIFDLTDSDLDKIVQIPAFKYEKHTSKTNRLFEVIMKIKRELLN